MKTYQMKIAGLTRNLPLCAVSDTLDIAAFILFGDVEITVAAAGALLDKAPDFDVIVTPEAKSIPLAFEMSKQSGKPYIVVRKGLKVYMNDPISVTVRSITTQRKQTLYLGSAEAEMIKGKRVLIIDDVISTGESLTAVKTLIESAQGNVCGMGAVLAEGGAAERKDIFYLEPLPVFPK